MIVALGIPEDEPLPFLQDPMPGQPVADGIEQL